MTCKVKSRRSAVGRPDPMAGLSLGRWPDMALGQTSVCDRVGAVYFTAEGHSCGRATAIHTSGARPCCGTGECGAPDAPRSVPPRPGSARHAVCVGAMTGVTNWDGLVLTVKAASRGRHQRTRTDAYGFPRLHLPQSRRVHGFATGDLVAAYEPVGKHAGRHIGRVAVRSGGRSGSARETASGTSAARSFSARTATTTSLRGGSGVPFPASRPGVATPHLSP